MAEQYPDLANVFDRLDSQLSLMGTAEVIRCSDLASFLNIDPNQARSALDLFVEAGVLRRAEMIECAYCQMAADRSDYQEALDEDDEYRCTSCDRPLTDRTIELITTYKRGEKWERRPGAPIPHDSTSASTHIGAVPATIFEPTANRLPVALKVSRSIGSDAAVQALLALKDRKGWTMEELARHLGTTARTLQSFLTRRSVRNSTFRTMADRLGISPEDLLAGNVPRVG